MDKIPFELGNLIIEDLLALLGHIHLLQKIGILKGPFYFTTQIDYIDRIWHEFILHTKHYHEFCNTNFGEYLHHTPMIDENADVCVYEVKNQIDLLTQEIGADFVNRVFFLYPEIVSI